MNDKLLFKKKLYMLLVIPKNDHRYHKDFDSYFSGDNRPLLYKHIHIPFIDFKEKLVFIKILIFSHASSLLVQEHL